MDDMRRAQEQYDAMEEFTAPNPRERARLYDRLDEIEGRLEDLKMERQELLREKEEVEEQLQEWEG